MNEQRTNIAEGACRQVREQLPEHALGALDRADHDLIERHLRACAECRDEAARFEEVADLLPLGLALDQQPAADGWDRILRRIEEEQPPAASAHAPIAAATERAAISTSTHTAPRWTRYLPAALVAPLALALLVVSTWAFSLRSDDAGSDGPTVAVGPQMLNDGNVRTYAVERSCTNCQGSGQLGLSETSPLGMMVAWDFDPGEDHMVWGVTATGELMKVCELYVDPTGSVMQTFMLPGDSRTLREIYITDEHGALIYVAHLQPVTSDSPTAPANIN